jgi:hypothetical protein
MMWLNCRYFAKRIFANETVSHRSRGDDRSAFRAGQEPSGDKYQIKGRRVTRYNKSRQLGAIRNFEEKGFSFLAGVLFNEDYTVLRAAIIPYAVVKDRAKFIAHTNSHKLILHEDVWKAEGVEDVTDQLRAIPLSTLGIHHRGAREELEPS